MIEQHRHKLTFDFPHGGGVHCLNCDYRLSGNNLIEFLETCTDVTQPLNFEPAQQPPAEAGAVEYCACCSMSHIVNYVCTNCGREPRP